MTHKCNDDDRTIKLEQSYDERNGTNTNLNKEVH